MIFFCKAPFSDTMEKGAFLLFSMIIFCYQFKNRMPMILTQIGGKSKKHDEI